MRTNWNRLTLGALMLTSLFLFLCGCSGSGGGSNESSYKEVSGKVSDSATGLPSTNALVSAYAVNATGAVSSSPFNGPAAHMSNGQGEYLLQIPDSHQGGVMLQAETASGKLRAFSPALVQEQTVMISLASEMVVQFIIVNKAGAFTAENFQKAVLVLEPFFGLNFPRVAPPANGSAAHPAEQNLLVMTQSINTLLTSGHTIAEMVTLDSAGNIALGQGSLFTALNNAIEQVTADLINKGLIPGSYTIPVIIPVTEPQQIDTTRPSQPQNLTAAKTAGSVTLTWTAAPANENVTAYYVFRDKVMIAVVSSPALTYTDRLVSAATTYIYEVQARNAAGNASASAVKTVTTDSIAVYNVSGRVTYNGAALPSVNITITGTGFGSTVTDADGKYSFTCAREGSYTITAALSGYAFAPHFRTFVVSTADVTGQDFVASLGGAVDGQTTYPDGTVTTTTTYPDGTVITTITYPDGTVTTSTTYPDGTIITTTTYPDGTVTTSTTYPDGTIITSTTYPDGTVTTTTIYPNGTITAKTTYPNGTVTISTVYPNGAIIGGTNYPAGTIITATSYPNGSVTTATTYPTTGTVGATLIYP